MQRSNILIYSEFTDPCSCLSNPASLPVAILERQAPFDPGARSNASFQPRLWALPTNLPTVQTPRPEPFNSAYDDSFPRLTNAMRSTIAACGPRTHIRKGKLNA